MKLIEKKCPNCGASLEFSETDKSCKCPYCHRAFEIERDSHLDVSDIAEQFNLNDLHKTLDTMLPTPWFAKVLFTIVPIIVVCGFVFVFYNIYSFRVDENKEKIEEKQQLITSFDDLNEDQLETLDTESKSVAYQTSQGQSDNTYSYLSSESLRLEKVYVAYKKDSNVIVSIYRSGFHNFFNQADSHTIYTPVVYKNIYNNSFHLVLKNGKNPAPEYYFNPEKTSYVYAYSSLEDAYNEVVKPLEDDGYKVTSN